MSLDPQTLRERGGRIDIIVDHQNAPSGAAGFEQVLNRLSYGLTSGQRSFEG